MERDKRRRKGRRNGEISLGTDYSQGSQVHERCTEIARYLQSGKGMALEACLGDSTPGTHEQPSIADVQEPVLRGYRRSVKGTGDCKKKGVRRYNHRLDSWID